MLIIFEQTLQLSTGHRHLLFLFFCGSGEGGGQAELLLLVFMN